MREYALTRAVAIGEAGGTSWLKRLVRNWRAKRSIVRLETLDDHLLYDLGVTRAEVQWAAGLPLTVNAALALEERAFRRRKTRPNE
ncbi:MAG: DUF1127 domain-containing protein [Rhizobiales bacterium]|nr:DUF1127 domain-containing protein [Hyphomicrobiales bacterium]